MLAIFQGQAAGAGQHHVVVAHQVRGRADGVEPSAVARRAGAAESVPRRDTGDDRATAAAVPEDLGGAVVGGPQHRVEHFAVVWGQRRASQQQVVGDEQLDDRRDGDPPAVAVGNPLSRRAVQHDRGDVGALSGGFGRGLPGATVKAFEGCGCIVGRSLGQRGQRPLRGDDGQLRRRGVHRRGAVDPGLTTGHGQHRGGNRDQPRRPPSHSSPPRCSGEGTGLRDCCAPGWFSLTGRPTSCLGSHSLRSSLRCDPHSRSPSALMRFHCMRPHLAQLGSCLCRRWDGRPVRPEMHQIRPNPSARRRVTTATSPQPRAARKSHR